MIKITNTADSALIQMFGNIGQSFFEDGWTLDKFKAQTAGLSVSNLTVELKSNGGDIFEAFAIHDTIKAMPSRVTVRIVGASASAATVIASAGDRVEISENSRYLVHNAMTFVEGNKEELAETYAQLESIDNQILDIYVKRTGKSKDILAELMKSEKWMTAQEAKEWGFVDEIIKTKVDNKMDEEIKKPDEEVENATPEEMAAENEALKAQVAELEAKLAEYEMEQAQALENEVEAFVENAVKAGKIKAEAKESIKAFGISNKAAMVAMIENIVVPTAKLADVVNPAPAPVTLNKVTFMNAFKNGEYKNNLDKARADFKTVYGVNPQF